MEIFSLLGQLANHVMFLTGLIVGAKSLWEERYDRAGAYIAMAVLAKVSM